ncbi:hypothetical protein [Mumia zhuanghuii]|uniref:Uncharacterized protein n=1 Tax=Mumia zhuanghuii TaxID=2585211 RepID=A0A5C4MEI9_9ACTN|nr:hypothetical protein [Mumia zhuanghuii]TNC33503.1 hypothetical protein FHE65_28860 [Mumia zhuanghuii]
MLDDECRPGAKKGLPPPLCSDAEGMRASRLVERLRQLAERERTLCHERPARCVWRGRAAAGRDCRIRAQVGGHSASPRAACTVLHCFGLGRALLAKALEMRRVKLREERMRHAACAVGLLRRLEQRLCKDQRTAANLRYGRPLLSADTDMHQRAVHARLRLASPAAALAEPLADAVVEWLRKRGLGRWVQWLVRLHARRDVADPRPLALEDYDSSTLPELGAL